MTTAWEKMGKTPVEFMVWLKFPYESIHQHRPLGLKVLNPKMRDADFFGRESAYRNALNTIPERELLILAEEEARIFAEEDGYSDARTFLANQKAAEFYNEPEAEADFEAWARTPFWSLAEALALSFGKEPEVVNWERIKGLVSISKFAEQFKSRRRIFTRAEQSNALSAVMSPHLFLAWAERTRLEIPRALVDAIREFSPDGGAQKDRHDDLTVETRVLQAKSGEIASGRKLVAKRSAKSATSAAANQQQAGSKEPEIIDPEDEPLHPRNRKTLLMLIGTMVIHSYKYQIGSDMGRLTHTIEGQFENMKIKMHKDTVRNCIRSGIAMLKENGAAGI